MTKKLGGVHGVSKAHKMFNSIPSFRPIIDVTEATHYSLANNLSGLLKSLPENIYKVKDSFDTANKINQILPDIH